MKRWAVIWVNVKLTMATVIYVPGDNDQMTVANQRLQLAPQSESEPSSTPCAEFLAPKNGKNDSLRCINFTEARK